MVTEGIERGPFGAILVHQALPWATGIHLYTHHTHVCTTHTHISPGSSPFCSAPFSSGNSLLGTGHIEGMFFFIIQHNSPEMRTFGSLLTVTGQLDLTLLPSDNPSPCGGSR